LTERQLGCAHATASIGKGNSVRRFPNYVKAARQALNNVALTKRLTHRVRILEERIYALEMSLLSQDSVRVERLANLLRPQKNAHNFVRFGSDGDGGYVLPTDLVRPDVVISIGVGSECSVDEALAEIGARVIQFDHTVSASPSEHVNISFFQTGLSGASGGVQTRPLEELLRLADESDTSGMWLLLDAEGVEWELLKDERAPLHQFSVVTVEFHRLSWIMSEGPHAEVMLNGLERLMELFIPVGWNANNYAPALAIGGYWVPDVLEVTFISKEFFSAGTTLGYNAHVQQNNPLAGPLPDPFSKAPENPYGPSVVP